MASPAVLAEESAGAAPEFVRILPVDEVIDTVSVEVETGVLVGERRGDAIVFKGVPYAAPPTGSFRWKAPQPVAPWVGDRAAVSYEPPCPQPVPVYAAVPNQGGVAGVQSEDCLYLEVYAPAKAEKAPVVVWLHGGAAFLGAGHLGSYVGTSNAAKGIITVPINYRLGALGTFAHPALSEGGGPTGNFAMMDAVAALEWVASNIEAFGGDPENVTIAGQSAGGVMVVNLLTLSSARGLFDKAVIQSGAYVSPGTMLEDAEEKTVKALGAINVPEDVTAEQLRTISAQTFSYNPGLRGGFGTILDGVFFTQSPKSVLEGGQEADVPVLVGTNSGEGGFRAAKKLAEQVSDTGAPVWLYRFDYTPEFRKKAWPSGPIHSAELMFTFDSMDTSGWAAGDISDADRAMAAQVSSCWVAFYKMPVDATSLSCAGGVEWPAYGPGANTVMNFGSVIEVGEADAHPDGPGTDE
ncbi:MAG: carboxylesterase/lipase family protein [Alphaproteobacteria bacterium]|nr:carboxylesterase/lipase family protein [Alphaproteobacteria bacterium]